MVDTSISLTSKTAKDAVQEITEKLQKHSLCYGHGMLTPLDEAAYLVSFVLELPPDFNPTEQNVTLSQEQRMHMQELLRERIDMRKPLAYILGKTWLAGIEFLVDERVLIPRSPIAELINKRFSPWWPSTKEPSTILDLCTGSGCLGVLAAKQFERSQVHLSDIDKQALKLAKHNVVANQLEQRVTAILSDVFTQLPKHQYDIIIANPPYVPLSEQSVLPIEYKHEPAHALFAGEDGLEIAEQILLAANEYLNREGILLLEVGQSAQTLQAHFPYHNFTWLELEQGGEGVCVLTHEECCTIAIHQCN